MTFLWFYLAYNLLAIVPNHCHFVIIPLSAGEFNLRKFHDWICCTGSFLSRYHAGVQWAQSELLFHKCLQKQSACLGAWFYAPVVLEVIGKPGFNDFGWMSEYCWQDSASEWLHKLFEVWSKTFKSFTRYIFAWSHIQVHALVQLWPVLDLSFEVLQCVETAILLPEGFIL